MEFWGVEVKPGQSAKVDELELFNACIHISQVALGEATKKEKSSEPVVLYLKCGEQKLVLGTLIRDDIPQISLDLVLEKEFELSHNSKNASVFVCGYRVDDGPDPSSDDFSESDDDEGALTLQDNGKPEAKAENKKANESKNSLVGPSAKQVKIVDPKKDDEDESDDESDDDGSDDEDESGSPDEMDADSDSDEDESDEDDEEETPAKKVDQGKKRPNESASKTPVSAKKVKNATPDKSDGKKNAHTATPHPMKKGGKTPNSAAKGQSPSSGGPSSGKNFNKNFNKAFTPKSGQQQNRKVKHGRQ